MKIRNLDVAGIIALLSAIIGFAFYLGKLDERVKNLEKNCINNSTHSIEDNTRNILIDLALNNNLRPQGSPGALIDGSGFFNGRYELKANLQISDSYVELYFPLNSIHLNGIAQNSDGSYNLIGKNISAMVQSTLDFKGDPKYPNGVQFIFKNKKFESYIGTWLTVTDEMITQNGMIISQDIPRDNITEKVTGISLKFTIGTNSRMQYNGSFFINRIFIQGITP